MYRFSIVLPCYNVAKYLQRCLDSIFSNGFPNPLEVILINDGSTDNFIGVTSEYFNFDCNGGVAEINHKNNRVLVVNQNNVGLADARNRGFEFVTGEYLLFMDPDDYVSEGYFKRLDEKLAEKVDMLILGFIKATEEENGTISETKTVLPMEEYIYNTNRDIVKNIFPKYFGISTQDLKNGNGSFLPPKEHGGVWRICYNTDFLKINNLRFDSGLKTNEDRLFNSRCLSYAEKVTTISEAYYNYIIRKSGLFKSRNKKGMVKNKIYSLQIRADIIKNLNERGYDLGIDSYAGSNVLSVIELINNSAESYSDMKKYWMDSRVKESVKRVPYIGNVKFDVSLFLLKCHMPWLLFAVIRAMKKIGFNL